MRYYFIFLLIFPIFKLESTTNHYKISIDEVDYYSTFSLEATDSLLLYIYNHDNEEQINYYDPDGSTIKFTYIDPDKNINIRIIKKDDKLIINSQHNDREKYEEIKLDKTSWQQSMSYSLGEFALSDQNDTEFLLVRLDNFEAEKMKAERIDIEEITVAGKEYSAVRIKVRAAGIKSFLWHGTYWFRDSDGLFLRYEGLNGLPGSSKTIIEYLDKE
ncbi:MAG: hypothetical protein K9N07_02360 [Candidatus Cloacimonetes bacterium]|nr:hypothetical protein [Candidatus Cloacimonadota bacterium]